MSKSTKNNLPRKAVVLAAGLGTRLRPLTDSTPKPLLPVWGEPMLERILRMLEEWGVEEIAVNAHHIAEKVKAYCAARKGTAKITVSVEDEILGTLTVSKPSEELFGTISYQWDGVAGKITCDVGNIQVAILLDLDAMEKYVKEVKDTGIGANSIMNGLMQRGIIKDGAYGVDFDPTYEGYRSGSYTIKPPAQPDN